MSRQPQSNPRSSPSLPSWAIVAIFLIVLGISWWQTNSPKSDKSIPQKSTAPASIPEVDQSERPLAPAQHPIEPQVTIEPESEKQAEQGDVTRIENQTIRDQSGRIAYQGMIDLRPTLDRIERGDRNSHRNDGTTFQNRERRLPVKPSGYYKEYVHPTPKISGPGPQRVIIGKEGDIWYTPDHYQTFLRIK